MARDDQRCEMQAARRPPAARRLQCAVKWDRNLKPKLAICANALPSQTDTGIIAYKREMYRAKNGNRVTINHCLQYRVPDLGAVQRNVCFANVLDDVGDLALW